MFTFALLVLFFIEQDSVFLLPILNLENFITYHRLGRAEPCHNPTIYLIKFLHYSQIINMRILLSLLICCCLATFSAQGQTQRCANSIFVNGDLESGTPTGSHQDIDNAVGFSRIWAPASWADYYTGTSGPSGFSLPSPNTGNYAGCWIANHAGGGTTYREGFQAEIGFTLPANSGTYTLMFDAACMGGWGNSEIAVYALHNPGGGDAPNPPTSAYVPSNIALFGGVNTDLIGTVPVSASGCSNIKTTYSFTINTNAANFPAAGMTHIFITHSDNQSLSGALYMGFDNFCIPTSRNDNCPASWVVNGDVEDGVPTNSDQDIHLATGFDGIWNGSGLSTADYYPATFAPAGFTPPIPASGDYASCWIANYAGGGTTYREGFQSTLVSPITANTGSYQLSFEMACLYGWGTVEVAVYGINNASGGYGANPTSAYSPSNMALFGAGNTVLIGTITVNTSACNSIKTLQSLLIDSDASGFPAGGMTHFFVTHSDNSSINGAHYMAFDNFCLQSYKTTPCPDILRGSAQCTSTGYNYTLHTSSTTGSVILSSSCGTFTPSTITLTGATSYTVNFVPNGSCGNSIWVNYGATDADGMDCDQGRLQTQLPDCKGCECDESFYENVDQGFDYNEDCPNDYVRPIALQDDCDRVEWSLDGATIGFTSGNDPISFPHLTNATEICMVVTRTTPDGKTCDHKFCIEIEPRIVCDPDQQVFSARLNVTPNPATTQVSVTWDSRSMPDYVSVGVYNSSGIPVKFIDNLNSFDGNTSINIMDLPTGLYYIKVEGEGYTPAPVKFIKK